MEAAQHIAVVDDHRDIRDLVGKYLTQQGYRVSVADSAAALKRLLDRSLPDLIVLDVMMPGEDGLAACRHVRGTVDVPIIFLTAMAEEVDRIVGLEIGADDYLTKPFNPRELLARIKAVLRRVNSLPPQRGRLKLNALQFDRWTLNVGRRELIGLDGVAVALSTAEFRLLSAFIEHVGIVLSRDQLLDLTVGRTADGFDRAIDNQVSRLRKKIEADPKNPMLIKTHWGGGLLLHGRSGPGMMLLWRRSLAARFLLLVLLALALSQAITFLIFWDERGQALHAAAKGEFVSRTSSLALLLDTTPPSLRPDILNVSGTAYTRFWASRDGPSDPLGWQRQALAQLAKPLPGIVGKYAAYINGQASTAVDAADASVPPRLLDLSGNGAPFSRPAKFLYMDTAPNGMGLSVRLDDGTRLNAAYAKAMPNAFWTSQSAISLALTAAILSAIAIFGAQAIARPMRRLANAAELFGRGEAVPRLPESGPDDIRQTAETFNRMQERLQRFVEDRTRMLAAISHDLRTPLTSLRLRAEFVQDHDLQEKMLKTIEEIQTMTEAALAFAREDATVEATRTVDLSALVGSLCDDLAELGQNVIVSDGPKVLYRCRSDSLRRAIRNLVENAVRYGERATVSVVRNVDSLDIVVEDAGPGIPTGDMEQVFAPFFRLERSRNRETGGVGLGLSIARAIARHHGGDIVLENRSKGLRAIIRLPLIDMANQLAPTPAPEAPEPSGLRSMPI